VHKGETVGGPIVDEGPLHNEADGVVPSARFDTSIVTLISFKPAVSCAEV
jgi:hypothetical protein